MARTELPHGIILPAEYSDDWYDDMTSNLSKLDEVIGSDADKLSAENVGAAALSNDYDDLDNKPALKPVATSGDYDDLTDLPTYGITRYCSSAITDNSSVGFSNISSTNKIKIGDFLLDTNGKLYQISSVDTANETVSVTTPLTQLAVDANVVHLSGNENVNGEKVFGDVATFDGSYIGNEASTNGRSDLILESNRDTHGQSGLIFTKFRQNKAQGSLSGNDVVYLTLDLLENSIRTNGIFRFNFRDFINDVPQDIAFYPTGAKNSLGGSASGSSNNKWHLINGINPGALSLPDLSAGLDISGYINTGNSDNSYTPTVDGYISVKINNRQSCAIYANHGDLYTSSFSSIIDIDLGGYSASFFMPVTKNVACRIICRNAGSVVSAKFYPNLGNV